MPVGETADISEFVKDLEKLRAKVPTIINDTVHEITTTAYYYSQAYCPVVSGNLKQRSGCDITRPNVGVIFYSAPYAAWVEYGTGVYGPKGVGYVVRVHPPKKALHWVDRSGDHFAKSVYIKGMPPRGFLRGAVVTTRTLAPDLARAVFNRSVGET